MKRIISSICVVAVLAVAGITAFVVTKDEPAAKAPASTTASKESTQEVTPAVPTDPAVDSEDAQRFLQMNQILTEITQEALKRPKDQRMTADEISALVRSRVEELEAQR